MRGLSAGRVALLFGTTLQDSRVSEAPCNGRALVSQRGCPLGEALTGGGVLEAKIHFKLMLYPVLYPQT